ncbi:MAG: hypothetical protein GY826_38255, partial [Fuerstiella sp.]|nr:hypothetical protein [Fuerstiella sp.]
MQQLLKPIDNNSEHELGAPIRSAVSLKRRLIVVGFRTGWVAMVDTTSAETVSRFRVAKTGITSLVLGSDESWLVCGTGKNNDAGLIVYSTQQIADTRSPDVGLTRAAPEPVASVSLASVRRLRLSDDGRHLFAGLLSGEIAVVDTETWTVNGRWQGHEHG